MKTTKYKPGRFATHNDVPKTYRDLCQLYLPRPIRDQRENACGKDFVEAA
jgi:hypothetical protein